MTISTTTPVLIPVILSGGVGSRLWPVSRQQVPKPFIRLDDGKSLLQQAFLRAALLPQVTDILTVSNRELFFRIEDEYTEIADLLDKPINTHFILEPFGRNTAAAITAASLQVAERYGDNSILLVLAADHLISNQASFTAAVARAYRLAQQDHLVTFGIQPTSAETGYGYIEFNEHNVIRFVEKPTLDKAQAYINSGNFLWNSGMFCFSAATLLREMQTHSPQILETTEYCLQQSKHTTRHQRIHVEINAQHFERVPENSIDYAVMEKTSHAAVVPCEIGWSDIGCWRSLGDLTTADENNNRIEADAVVIDSKNCTIKSEQRVVGAIGIENLVIVDTPDALLVANKQHTQEVKQLYSQLKHQGHQAHKLHKTVHRPWGAYTVLEEGPYFKIKRLEVKPGGSLSLQMHQHRGEHWIIVSGTAKVLNNEQIFRLKVNESTFIPAGHKHRLENIGSEPLIIIEIQTGHYLGEDDIVRFEDAYGRIEA